LFRFGTWDQGPGICDKFERTECNNSFDVLQWLANQSALDQGGQTLSDIRRKRRATLECKTSPVQSKRVCKQPLGLNGRALYSTLHQFPRKAS
jgi:hypothetical protein